MADGGKLTKLALVAKEGQRVDGESKPILTLVTSENADPETEERRSCDPKSYVVARALCTQGGA
jgi:hypothetical protein